jgi:hypothetical protein
MIDACTLWNSLEPNNNETRLQWYERLLNTFDHIFPCATHIVDTSKSIHTISPWLEMKRIKLISDVKIVYLVRDVRGWVFSDRYRRIRKNRPVRLIPHSMMSWWKSQKRSLFFLNKNFNEKNYLTVSYESFIFQTDDQLKRMSSFCDFGNIQNDSFHGIGDSIVHDITGNRIINSPESRQTLRYDDRWLYDATINLMLPILFPIWRLNARLRRLGGG